MEHTQKRHLSAVWAVLVLLTIASTPYWMNAEEGRINQSVKVITTGGKQTCAVTDDENALCWGQGGQIGDGSSTTRSLPVQVAGLTSGVRTIASGLNHTCAALNNGTVRCWGRNEHAQLGDGSTNSSTAPVTLPVQVFGVGKVIQLAGGGTHTCALSENGSVKCWGQNDFYAAGGRFKPQQVPIDIIGLGSGVKQITSGDQFSCALMNTGVVKCWGLIDGVTDWGGLKAAPINIPLSRKAIAVAAGFQHACAVFDNGQVACWGNNGYGETGIEVGTGGNTVAIVAGIQNVVDIAAGKYETCAIVSGGGVRCWGLNANGQLGNGAFDNSFVPVTVKGLPGPAVAIDVAKHTEYDASGPRWYGGHACAIIDNGSMWCWGNSTYGQLGDGTFSQARPRPVAVKGLDTIRVLPTSTPLPIGSYRVMLPLKLNQVFIEGDSPTIEPTLEPTSIPDASVTPEATPPTITLDCCEPNNEFVISAAIEDNGLLHASVNYDTDPVDIYKVTLNGGSTYTFRLNHQGIADLDLYLFVNDLGGKKVAQSNQLGNENEFISFTPDVTRQYYIVVNILTRDKNSTYDLSISR